MRIGKVDIIDLLSFRYIKWAWRYTLLTVIMDREPDNKKYAELAVRLSYLEDEAVKKGWLLTCECRTVR